MAHASIKHSMPQLVISFAMLYQPTRPPTVVAVTLSQLGRHYPTLDHAVLAGNLLAVGGDEIPEGGAPKKEVYMYSPSTNSWIYISNLPAPRSLTAVAVLSSTRVLVIGGGNEREKVNTVYQGTLTCTMSV